MQQSDRKATPAFLPGIWSTDGYIRGWAQGHRMGGECIAPLQSHGYEEFVDTILHRKRSQEARDYLQWVGGEFDPEAFDRRMANNALLRMAWNGWGKK